MRASTSAGSRLLWIGTQFAAYVAVDSQDDANKAMAVLEKA